MRAAGRPRDAGWGFNLHYAWSHRVEAERSAMAGERTL
jgi:hypothetical protein